MLRLSIKPSLRLALLLFFAHSAALAGVMVVSMAIWLKLVLALLIAVSCSVHLCNSAFLLGARAIVELEIKGDGAVYLRARRGDWKSARFMGSSFVSPALTILNLRTDFEWRPYHAIITADNADTEAYRKLRVWLRWKKLPGNR